MVLISLLNSYYFIRRVIGFISRRFQTLETRKGGHRETGEYSGVFLTPFSSKEWKKVSRVCIAPLCANNRFLCVDNSHKILVSRFPGLRDIRLVPNRSGIAFVEFDSEEVAAPARMALNNFKISPEQVFIYLALEWKDCSRTS